MDPDYTDLEAYTLDELIAMNQELGRRQDILRVQRKQLADAIRLRLLQAPPPRGPVVEAAGDLPTIHVQPTE